MHAHIHVCENIGQLAGVGVNGLSITCVFAAGVGVNGLSMTCVFVFIRSSNAGWLCDGAGACVSDACPKAVQHGDRAVFCLCLDRRIARRIV